MLLDCAGKTLDLSQAAVMGILNITPDSFSDGGLFFDADEAAAQGLAMAANGADIIDIGGESTRPGADAVSCEEELRRVIPVIEQLSGQIDIPISIDTSKPDVMIEAVRAGASFINDVNALRAPGAIEAASELNVPVCLMHMQGTPDSMQNEPVYEDVTNEIKSFLDERVAACLDAGIKRKNLVIDPGFGFGKTVRHNLELLNNLQKFKKTGLPVLVGLSRKSLIEKVLGTPVDQRLPASLSLAVMAVQHGADILRVHDVAETRDAVRMTESVTALAT